MHGGVFIGAIQIALHAASAKDKPKRTKIRGDKSDSARLARKG